MLERTDGTAIVKVKDTGVGISPQEQEKIFKRFYRVDKSRSRDTGGTGLGLSIAQWIAHAHNGGIEVISELDKGSTFIVRLPLHHPLGLQPFIGPQGLEPKGSLKHRPT
jgi:signal transduction histidine kinase